MRIEMRCGCCLLGAVAVTGSLLGAVCRAEEATASSGVHERRAAYQRQRVDDRRLNNVHADVKGAFHRSFGKSPHTGRRPFDRSPHPVITSSSSWFQRPYPYHLDYYKMRFGGTYEPYYVGGLYGTPQYIIPPAYGFGFGYGMTQPFGFAPGSAGGYGETLPTGPPAGAEQ